MEPGDGQQMRDARDRPFVPDLVREGAAQAREERHADRSRGARDGEGDPLRDALAQGRDAERPAALFGTGEQFRCAQGIANRP